MSPNYDIIALKNSFFLSNHSQIWLNPLGHYGEPTNLTNLGKKTLALSLSESSFCYSCCAAHLGTFTISIAAKKMDDL
jgi:hypothetical protein